MLTGFAAAFAIWVARQSNASLLIRQNVDVPTVASLLGHAQASTTPDIYSHAFDKTKKEAGEKLAGVLDI